MKLLCLLLLLVTAAQPSTHALITRRWRLLYWLTIIVYILKDILRSAKRNICEIFTCSCLVVLYVIPCSCTTCIAIYRRGHPSSSPSLLHRCRHAFRRRRRRRRRVLQFLRSFLPRSERAEYLLTHLPPRRSLLYVLPLIM